MILFLYKLFGVVFSVYHFLCTDLCTKTLLANRWHNSYVLFAADELD